jgi:hypothetical protein
MKTKEFFSLLENNKDKALLFEYTPGKFVEANYHITEVKHIKIDSVDCGSGTDAWNETIVQLWESPSEKDKRDYMSIFKALGILKKVGQMKPYDMEAEVKFEYSNDTFHTAQLFLNDYSVSENQLILQLGIQKTDCKAKEICGVPEPAMAEAQGSCTPGGGCC